MIVKKTVLLSFLWVYICFGKETVFHAHLQGWYPTEQKALEQKLGELDTYAQQHYFMQADSKKIRALIVPHAGYQYSGEVAAAAYRILKGGNFKRIIILAPSHQELFSGIALPTFTHYQTPLGSIAIDQSVVQELKKHTLFSYQPKVFGVEHSLEIQLPFLQKYLKDFQLVPLIVGNCTQQQIRGIAKTLQPYLDAATLLVISSDFTHYGKRFNFDPFNDHFQDRIRLLDSQALQPIQDYSLNGFTNFITKTKATICGRLPILILLALVEQKAFDDVEGRLAAYATSYEKTKQANDSVSYVGMIFTNEKRTLLPLQNQLTQYEKKSLLTFARRVLTNAFTKSEQDTQLFTPILTGPLRESMGAFVTLYKPGKVLRGCIGRIITSDPLYKTVSDMILAAAFSDSRFQPLKQQELTDITIDISVLTKPRVIDSYNKIKLGSHGIILKAQGRLAVFLPQVATEQGWDLPTTLTHLSTKAGEPADAWNKDGTKFEVFESIEFSE